MTRRKHKSQPDDPHAVSHQARPPFAASCEDRLRPWLLGGMTALCVARPLFPSESAAVYGDGLTMVMLWIALAVFWLLGAIGRPKFAVRFGWTDVAVLLLIGWYAVATFWAVKNAAPRPALNMFWEWLGMGLCYLLARQFIATACEARAVVAVMVALAVALSGYGLFQYGYEMPQTRAEYKADPDRAMRNAGLWFPADSPERKLFENRLESREPMATFALTNSLAGYLAPWFVVLIGVMCGAGANRRRLIGMILCAVVIATCLLLTKSRSGYLAVGVGVPLVWLLCRERRLRFGWKVPAAIGTLTAIVIAVAVSVGGLDREILSEASKSFGYRLQYWQSSLHMIADHPTVGCGPGNFQNAYPQYKLPTASEEVADPHNFLLEICATAGAPAGLAFLLVLGCFAWTMIASEQPGGWGQHNWALKCPALDWLSLPHTSTSSNPQSLISNSDPPADAWLHVLLGGAAGFLLSLPVAMLCAAPPGVTVVVLGLPLAAGTVALLLGWIQHGRLPSLLPAVGVVVLLINLLAAGGIGFPAVAGTLWLLLALGLQGQTPREFRPPVAWALFFVALGLAVTCYATAYNPVLGCQVQMRMAERQPTRAIEHLEAAAAADPLASEPWRQLAAIEFERWWQQPSEEAFARFERANATAIRLAPNSAPAWLAAGDWYFRAFTKTDAKGKNVAPEAIREAISAYGKAVERYPNSALYRAKLGEASQAIGDREEFRRQAQAALELDDATPHIDKKLPADLRDRLLRALGSVP